MKQLDTELEDLETDFSHLSDLDVADAQSELNTIVIPAFTVTKLQIWNLYLSHALSTWNARTYEFAAILFTASAFPETLLAASLRGICNDTAVLFVSFSIGHYIDNAPSRLRTLLMTICANRGSVLLGCVGWLYLVQSGDPFSRTSPESEAPGSTTSSVWIFAVVVLIGVFENLSGISNLISMERDWVLVMGKAASQTLPGYELTHLNAVMRRIDLICKLVGPLVISFIITATSMRTGIFAVATMSACSWGIEMISAWHVWSQCPMLQEAKVTKKPINKADEPKSLKNGGYGAVLLQWRKTHTTQMKEFFRTEVWIPSLALALCHINVMTYRDSFITFLLESGFSLVFITVARTLGSVLEISSTFVVPWSIIYLGNVQVTQEETEGEETLLQGEKEERKHGIGLERTGLWGIALQSCCLVPVVLAIWQIPIRRPVMAQSNSISERFLANLQSTPSHPQPTATDNPLFLRFLMPASSPSFAAVTMFSFLSMSRLGVWVYDLTTQELTQTRVPTRTTSSFAGTERAFVSVFEIAQRVMVALFPRPSQFKWLSTNSQRTSATLG
ncbi:hypothetical protein MMC25_006643 [Agyrium rufum]|nr:hypothetical protein [Agyrium rufum]